MLSYSVRQVRNNVEKSPHFPKYLRSKLTKPLVSENTPRARHLVVTSHMTQKTSIPRVPSCCSRQACMKNVCLWEQSDFEMEFDILMHEYEPFDCVLQFSRVRCDVTSENSRKIYESTPFCLVNNKVLDLGKYCKFDQKFIGYVSLIHSSARWVQVVLPLHFYFNVHCEPIIVLISKRCGSLVFIFRFIILCSDGRLWQPETTQATCQRTESHIATEKVERKETDSSRVVFKFCHLSLRGFKGNWAPDHTNSL